MERKLASIRLVKEIQPIPNADNIELAMVDGWQCVVKKGEFKVGDKAVYFEIDSWLPERPEFEFLRKSSHCEFNGRPGFRLKTIRLRKALSQGLLMPLSAFDINVDTEIGADMTEFLKVELYEKPLPVQLAGSAKCYLPAFIKKTDQERIQNIPEVLEQYRGQVFELTEKLDGTSMTVYYNQGEFEVCGRNVILKNEPETAYWRYVRENNIEQMITDYCKENNVNYAFQGELIGPGIQGNPYKLQSLQWRIFDIWDIDHQRHLTPMERADVFNHIHLDEVPFLQFVHLDYSLEKILNVPNQQSMLGIFSDNVQMEGVVFKSMKLYNGQIVSFKVINNEYLLSEKE